MSKGYSVRKEGNCFYIYIPENCTYAIEHALAGHAEGQKATVEAKSAGVWVNELRRLLESESVKALLRFAYKNPMRSGMDDFEGKEYIDLYHFDTSVMQPSTPNT